MKRPDAILAADLHLMEHTPVCRLDKDFMATQACKYAQIGALQRKYNVPILVAGDLFTHWKPSPFLLAWTFRNLPNGIIAIPGQHDLPAHNMEDIHKSGIQVLADAGKITLLKGSDEDYCDFNRIMCIGFPWGVPMSKTERGFGEQRAVALLHHLVYKGKPPFPGAENSGGTAKSILQKMEGFDLIVSGDNHQTFVEEYKGRLLVNPGSLLRSRSDQIDHKPSVFLWYAKDNTVEQVYLDVPQGVISRDHIDRPAERNDRMEEFLVKAKNTGVVSIDYEKNMKHHIAANRIDKAVADIIWRAME